jgi:hypothetical protein
LTVAITLDSITLPQGLRYADEFAWSPLAQTLEYSITGALIIEQAVKLAGRPITLTGGKEFAWRTRAQVVALKALLDAGDAMTLTLHDARTFTVFPAADPLVVSPLPIALDSGPADPSDSTLYVLESLKLIEV